MEVHFQSTNLFTRESFVMNKNIFFVFIVVNYYPGGGQYYCRVFQLEARKKINIRHQYLIKLRGKRKKSVTFFLSKYLQL